jgi:hypothetical protein
LDFTGPYQPTKEGYTVLLHICDKLTKFSVYLPQIDSTSASTTKSLRTCFSLLGYPKIIYSDNANVFRGRRLTKWAATNGVLWRFTPRHAPWYAGWLERQHRTLHTVLKIFLNKFKGSWNDYVHIAQYALNHQAYEGSTISPATMMLGMDTTTTTLPTASAEVHTENELLHARTDERSRLQADFAHIWERARNRTKYQLLKSMKRDFPHYADGDSVLYFQAKPSKLMLQWKKGVVHRRISRTRYSIVTEKNATIDMHIRNLRPFFTGAAVAEDADGDDDAESAQDEADIDLTEDNFGIKQEEDSTTPIDSPDVEVIETSSSDSAADTPSRVWPAVFDFPLPTELLTKRRRVQIPKM